MKIAVLGTRGLPANYSGFETCVDHTSKNWAKDGHSVMVYCRKNRYKDKIRNYNGVKLRYISQLSIKGVETLSHTLLSIFDLCLFYRSFNHVHLYNVGNAIFIPILKAFNKKVIISVDGIEWKRDKWGKFAKTMYKIGEKFAVRWADITVADNEEISNYYYSRYGKKTTQIPYGAKILKPNEQLAKSVLSKFNLESKKYFIFIGRLVPEKGVHHLISVYKKLNTDYQLVIIGDDHSSSEYKEDLFREDSDSIKMLGFRFGDDYEQLLSNSLLYISASKLEGTSPSLLAAMGAGVCALVNGIPENKYTVNDAAFTFKENDYNDLLNVLSDLITHPEKMTKMAEKGRDHVVREYSWEKVANDYLDAFGSLSKSKTVNTQ